MRVTIQSQKKKGERLYFEQHVVTQLAEGSESLGFKPGDNLVDGAGRDIGCVLEQDGDNLTLVFTTWTFLKWGVTSLEITALPGGKYQVEGIRDADKVGGSAGGSVPEGDKPARFWSGPE